MIVTTGGTVASMTGVGGAASMALPGIGAALAIGSAAASAYGQAKANKASKKAARRLRIGNRYDYRNRYKYTMADMKKSGLNPILAYGGTPGGVPGGSAAPQHNIIPQTDLIKSAGTGEQIKKSTLERKNLEASLQNIEQDTVKKQAETTNVGVNSAKTSLESEKLDSELQYKDPQAFGQLPLSGKAKWAFDKFPTFLKKLRNTDFRKNLDRVRRRVRQKNYIPTNKPWNERTP